MALVEIPCAPNGQAHWTQRTALDGTDYLLTFDWNQRDGRWYLDLADQDGTALVAGRALVAGYPLLRSVPGTTRPAGELVLLDTQGLDEDPTYSGLGDRWVLCYYLAGDLT